MLSTSMGFGAHAAEENDIRSILNSLLSPIIYNRINEIILMPSNCTDKTDKVIKKELLQDNSKIILLNSI